MLKFALARRQQQAFDFEKVTFYIISQVVLREEKPWIVKSIGLWSFHLEGLNLVHIYNIYAMFNLSQV